MPFKKNQTINSKTLLVIHYFMHKNKSAEIQNLTNKKLQKLLFYTQAWHLALYDKPLLKEKFEAWIHGAAIPTVYNRYKQYGFDVINEEYDENEFHKFSRDEKKLLDEIWEIYGKYDADYLELLNHNEAPWQKARVNLQPFDASSNIISENDMKEYYGKKLKEVQSR